MVRSFGTGQPRRNAICHANFSFNFTITVDQEVLSKRIFSETPDLVY